ncbi:acyltransferase [Vibrio lamellibrachiae]|uniref:acyltransferase family protein n=1 Tax=Vibrio lamellibrachiae TaxID=2910253 RepID=UPI003D0A3C68
MIFRHDINSLRAFAVVAVVIYHFFPSILPGGFIGVDIFFVISGYLMTRIILQGIDSSAFSLLRFYYNRAKRILPALAFLSLVLLVLGWFILAPLEYYNLARHVASSLAFISNSVYLSESGYFDASPRDKWLLHTWSLSVEWQFYLLYPLLLISLKNVFSIKQLKPALIALCTLSFVFTVFSSYIWADLKYTSPYWTELSSISTNFLPLIWYEFISHLWDNNSSYTWSDASYFLLPMRAWEMLSGGVAFIMSKDLNIQWKRNLEYIGLTLMTLSLFIIDSTIPWPGIMTMIPVVGAMLVILANRQESLFSTTRAFHYLGTRSYSIYLWHWPIMSILYYLYTPTPFILLAGVLAAFLIGFASYQFIESKKSIFLPVAIALLSSIVLISSGGFAYQVPLDVYKASLINPKSKEYGLYTWELHKQFSKGFANEKPNILIIGDSQAGDFRNILEILKVPDLYEVKSSRIAAKCGAIYIDSSIRDEYSTHAPAIKSGKVPLEGCIHEWERYYQHDILENANVIFLAMFWDKYTIDYVSHSVSKIREKNKDAKIFIVGSKSLGADIPREMYRAYREGIPVNSKVYEMAAKKHFLTMKMFEKEVSSLNNVTYVNMKTALCDDIARTCSVVVNGDPVFYDKNHSTYEGNRYMAKYVQSFLLDNDLL